MPILGPRKTAVENWGNKKKERRSGTKVKFWWRDWCDEVPNEDSKTTNRKIIWKFR